MDTILLVGFSSNGRDKEKLAVYQQQIQQATDATVRCCYFDELSIELAPGHFRIFDHRNQRELQTYDMVLLKGAIERMYLANAVSDYLNMHGIPCINDYRQYKAANKLLQAIDFYKAAVPFPATLYSANRNLLLDLSIAKFGYPHIIKAVAGSQGKDNYRIQNEKELTQLRQADTTTSYIAQEYIQNDYDYRLLYIGERRLVVRRTSQAESHLNNLSQGATIQVVDENTLPSEVIAQATKIVKSSGLVLAGVDVIIGAGSHYFLEINSQPGWRTLEGQVEPLLRQLIDDLNR